MRAAEALRFVDGMPLALANSRPVALAAFLSANSSKSIKTVPAAVFRTGGRSSAGGEASARTCTAAGDRGASFALPHRSRTAPADTSSETGSAEAASAPCSRLLLAATRAFWSSVRATDTASEPAQPGGAAREAPASGMRAGSEPDPATVSESSEGVRASALTYSLNRIVRTPLPMSSAGGLDASSAGAVPSGTTATATPPARPAAAPYPARRLPARSAANPSSRRRTAGAPNPSSADASTASIRAALWSAAILAVIVSPSVPLARTEWPASGMRCLPSPPAEPSNTAMSMCGTAAVDGAAAVLLPSLGQDGEAATASSK